MNYIELEKQLDKKQNKRRIIFVLGALLSLALFLFAIVMREASKEVVVWDLYFYKDELVTYNENWIYLIIPTIISFFYLIIVLCVDLALCKYIIVEKDSQHITIYKSQLKTIVYLDGTEVGRIEPFSYEYVIETKLLNDVKATISFPQSGGILSGFAHISFSDNTSSIQLH